MTADPRPRTRLHLDEPLAEGRTVEAGEARAHYLRNVLRLGPGDAVALFNARDGEWLATVQAVGKGRCALAVGPRRRAPEPEPDLWLLFAPVKRAAVDLIAEKAAELGASRLWPVVTRHTDVARVNADRLRLIATEAAEQCERLSVPEVLEPEPLARVLDTWPAGRTLHVCAEAGAARPAAEAFAEAPDGPGAVLVGPEGGFAREELDDLRARPFVVPVGLGPRILRAETAALAALALWQAIRGDRNARPPMRS